MNVENENYSAVTIVHKNLKNERFPKKVTLLDKDKEKKHNNPNPQNQLDDSEEEGHVDRYI